MNGQNTDSYEFRKLIGQIKFSFIAPVVSRTFTDDSISAYFKRVSKREIDWPDGTKRKFSDQTMKWWLYKYRKNGFDGLMPKDRLDLDRVRKLDEEHKEYIASLINQYPKITGVMIYEKMIEDGVLNKGDCSVDTIQRYIRNSGLRNGNGETFTCHTFYIYDEENIYRKTYLIAIIDNHSRMIVGAEFFFNDNAINFQKVWHDAVLRYGRSKVIILDNGSSYKNKSTKEIEARLGTKIIYNPPYSPTGKALIERFFHTMKMRFMDVHNGSDYHSLGQLNNDLNKWINEYNRTIHSSLKEDENDNHTPLERYMYDMKDIEVSRLANKSPVDYVPWLDDVFLHETTRKVNGDSTVLVDNQLFDVPSVYIGMRVIIRYNPRTFEGTYLYDIAQKKKVPLKRTDRIENGKTRREEIIY